jgi:sulfur carrier protein ThiS
MLIHLLVRISGCCTPFEKPIEMNENEIINKAIQELKLAEKPYVMFKDFSFLSEMKWEEDRFQKIRYLLVKSSPFEKHTDHAIKFSEIGLDIANNHKDWFDYRKSLKPKTDYLKWIGVGIAGLSLIWNIYQGITNSKLRDDNRILGDEIETLEKENVGLEQLLKKSTE